MVDSCRVFFFPFHLSGDQCYKLHASTVKRKRGSPVLFSRLPKRFISLLPLPVATWTLYRASLILTIVGTSTDRDDHRVFRFLDKWWQGRMEKKKKIQRAKFKIFFFFFFSYSIRTNNICLNPSKLFERSKACRR